MVVSESSLIESALENSGIFFHHFVRNVSLSTKASIRFRKPFPFWWFSFTIFAIAFL